MNRKPFWENEDSFAKNHVKNCPVVLKSSKGKQINKLTTIFIYKDEDKKQ